MKKAVLYFVFLHCVASLGALTPPPAPDFTITTSDGQVKSLYQDYINQQKLVVIEAFFTTCPPCATHAPLVQSLYTSMQAAHPGKVEFILLSTLTSDTNVKVAQYKTSKGLTMPAAGKDGGSITALQPYLNGQFGAFQGTPTFIVIAPGSGAVFFDIRGNSASQTIALLEQKIEEFFPKSCLLENPFGTALDQVTLSINAPAFDTAFQASGMYSLSQIAPLQGSSFSLKPFKSGPNTGLTTYDLVLISKHILAIEPFNCPWQIVAADVNCTGSVTTFDIVTARKVILGILDSFPCGSWRFMPDSASLSSGDCQDFIGVKLGDVNAGPCNDSLYNGAESRASTQPLRSVDYTLEPGASAQVSFFMQENMALEGLQLALEFDQNLVKINGVRTETLEDFDDQSYQLDKQGLAISWLKPQGQTLQAAAPLLTLDLTAPQGGKLSELLQLAPSRMTPELYGLQGKVHPIHLSWTSATSAFVLAPNPAHERFRLSFFAEYAGENRLQLFDLQGNLVLEHDYTASRGQNSLEMVLPSGLQGLFILCANGKVVGKLTVEGL